MMKNIEQFLKKHRELSEALVVIIPIALFPLLFWLIVLISPLLASMNPQVASEPENIYGFLPVIFATFSVFVVLPILIFVYLVRLINRKFGQKWSIFLGSLTIILVVSSLFILQLTGHLL